MYFNLLSNGAVLQTGAKIKRSSFWDVGRYFST